VCEVCERGPTRIQDPVLPLRQHFQPRVEMKLNVVAGRSAEEKEWNLGREDCPSDCQKWLPPKAVRLRRGPRVKSRARASQSVLFQLRDSTRNAKFGRSNLTQI
jgi:hypothetical protein